MALTLIPPGQRKGNKHYVARGSIEGRVYEFSTGTADEKLARRFAREFAAKAKTESRVGGRVTFAEAARRYVEFRDPGKEDRADIDRAVAVIGKRVIHDILPTDLHDLAKRIAGDRTAQTRNRHVLRPCITVLHHASRSGLCGWIRVPMFNEPRPKTRALHPEDAAALIEAVPAGPKRLLLTWLFYQGTRISDTLRVRWEDIDLGRNIVRVHVKKTDRTHEFPLHAAVLAELPEVGEGKLFPWSSRSSIQRWRKELSADSGIVFTAHMARHTLGSMLAANGATLRAIMGALGHESAKSSLRYQNGDIEMVRAATAAIRLPQGKKSGKAH